MSTRESLFSDFFSHGKTLSSRVLQSLLAGAKSVSDVLLLKEI